MRPLNENETLNHNQTVWKVLPSNQCVTQTTAQGQPLSDRVWNRTYFTYDQTFDTRSTTRHVYDSVARNIVQSVTTGLNGTIFAYGQTSSGKTYTMQGSGSIEEGHADGGGLVHMAARDVLSHVAATPERVFLIRVAFLEIYNEEVRDLLTSDKGQAPPILQIREDPRRGVFVQCREEMVTDYEALLALLVRGEKHRAFAATSMNERSSRSHTIFRITVESRKKSASRTKETDENDDPAEQEAVDEGDLDDDDDGAVLISTLNLVDLAGSESVRLTGATGERQKEGGMINQRYVLHVIAGQ